MLLDKVKSTIKKNNLIARNDRIVIGVSGGPDSVTLLLVLHSLKQELNLTLQAAHLDHSLRADSHKDAEFVKNLCLKLGTALTVEKIDLTTNRDKGSLEEVARNARLKFLFKTAKSAHAKKIALGHTLDDQAETVLMRIIRGSGLQGLSGIVPRREFAGYLLIRPLIGITRKEVDAYLKRKKVTARIDATNFQDRFLRNRIRNKLLPFLEKRFNKNIKVLLSNMAESAGYDYDYLNKAAEKAAKGMGKRIPIHIFLKLHPALQRLVLRAAVRKIAKDTRRITFQHIKELQDLLYNRPVDSIVDLPKSLHAIKKRNAITFYRKTNQ